MTFIARYHITYDPTTQRFTVYRNGESIGETLTRLGAQQKIGHSRYRDLVAAQDYRETLPPGSPEHAAMKAQLLELSRLHCQDSSMPPQPDPYWTNPQPVPPRPRKPRGKALPIREKKPPKESRLKIRLVPYRPKA
jgi:hypothetical protein